MQKINTILVDFKPENIESFKEKLELYSKEKWEVNGVVADGKQRNIFTKVVKVYTMYFLYPLKILFSINKYKRILAWQQFFGITLAFYCRLFHIKENVYIYISTFIYKPKKGIIGSIYYKYIKFAIKSKYVKKIICFSKEEVEYYKNIFGLDKEKIFYCLYGRGQLVNLNKLQINKYTEKSYFLSVGRSNRDYNFLINALRDKNFNLLIICDKLKNGKIKNITIKNNVFSEEYIKYLEKSFAVIIPLDDVNVSSGQMVFLKAMEYGKPIIITKNNCLNSYIINDFNGLIINKNDHELVEAMKLLIENKDKYNEMVENAVTYFNNNFTDDSFAKNITNAISTCKL